MAGLTRTQKYAQLRSELNNNSEPQVTTDDLSSYRDKLKGFEESFNKELDDTFAKIEEKSRTDTVPSYQDLNTQFKSQQNNDQFIDFLGALDTRNLEQDINNAITANTEPAKVAAPAPTINPQPAPAPQPVYVQQQPVQVLQPETPVIVAAPVQPAPVHSTVTNEIAGQFRDVMNDLDSITAPQPVPAPQPAPAPQPVNVAPAPVVNNEYVNDTLKEVADYNRNEGNRTIDQIPNEIVDAVRHPENLNREETDDEFSSTVTLEIDKVLNEVRQDEPEKAETKAEPAKEEETFEHPVIAKELEKEKEVEILPLNETLKMDVIDDTIPFTAEKETENEVADEDEDSGFSKVINVILVILIVILIAILGVIVYYILYAKGIIG